MVKNFVAKALLFDQLTDNSEFLKGEKNIGIFLEKEQFLASLQKELTDIFNTRSSFSSEEIDALLEKVDHESALSGIEGMMGLPNMKNTFVEGAEEWSDFTDKCEMMVRFYEPRLQNPCIQIESFNAQQQSFYLTITGNILTGKFRENVSFLVPVQQNQE